MKTLEDSCQMSRNQLFGLLVLLALATCLWSGCGKSGGKVLAVVGDYKITTDEFQEFYTAGYPFPTAKEEFTVKRQIIDSAIVTRLLVQAAYEKHIDKLEELARVVLANKDKFLIDILLQHKIADKVEPSETEVKEFYKRLEYKIKASHILVDNPDTAQMLLERIIDAAVDTADAARSLAAAVAAEVRGRRGGGHSFDEGSEFFGHSVSSLSSATRAMRVAGHPPRPGFLSTSTRLSLCTTQSKTLSCSSRRTSLERSPLICRSSAES